MKKLLFKDKENNEISKIESSNNNPGQDMHLNEGEEIIGIYGHKILTKFLTALVLLSGDPNLTD